MSDFSWESNYNFPNMLQVLVRDLAIFGFFIALGRRTQTFLSANGFDEVPEPLERLIRYYKLLYNVMSSSLDLTIWWPDLVMCHCRYLIGGSVLYYPQLSSISSYQLYVEVSMKQFPLSHRLLSFAN